MTKNRRRVLSFDSLEGRIALDGDPSTDIIDADPVTSAQPPPVVYTPPPTTFSGQLSQFGSDLMDAARAARDAMTDAFHSQIIQPAIDWLNGERIESNPQPLPPVYLPDTTDLADGPHSQSGTTPA